MSFFRFFQLDSLTAILPNMRIPLIAAALCVWLAAPALAQQLQQEREALQGEEHEFGEAFILSLGGKLYDDLWAATATRPPDRRNPDFPTTPDLVDADTWRCVSCHGWDYTGAPVTGNSEDQKTQFVSLRHLEGRSPFALEDQFDKAHPDYVPEEAGSLITELVLLFLSQGQYDARVFLPIDAETSARFNRGRDIFEGACMSCHNPDGVADWDTIADIGSSLGKLARENPKKTLHRIFNGVPGKAMLAIRFMENDAIEDLVLYLRSLDAENTD